MFLYPRILTLRVSTLDAIVELFTQTPEIDMGSIQSRCNY